MAAAKKRRSGGREPAQYLPLEDPESYLAFDWFPDIRPDDDGAMPISAAIHWIASDGRKINHDLFSAEGRASYRSAAGALFGKVASGKVRVIGENENEESEFLPVAEFGELRAYFDFAKDNDDIFQASAGNDKRLEVNVSGENDESRGQDALPALSANQSGTLNGSTATGDDAEIPANRIQRESIYERLYGNRAAEILRNCQRDVALASAGDGKIAAFRKAATMLGEAVAGQWLPKDVIADHLQNIANAHNLFGLNPEGVQEIIAEAVACARSPMVQSPTKPLRRHLISHRASDVRPERLEWIWPGRIARGKVALLGGPPGLGKSQVTANVAAIVSIGGHWPCAEGRSPQGDVIILSAEDGIADTIVPRLIAAGANRERIRIVAAATKRNRPEDVLAQD
jgi:AAA domain